MHTPCINMLEMNLRKLSPRERSMTMEKRRSPCILRMGMRPMTKNSNGYVEDSNSSNNPMEEGQEFPYNRLGSGDTSQGPRILVLPLPTRSISPFHLYLR